MILEENGTGALATGDVEPNRSRLWRGRAANEQQDKQGNGTFVHGVQNVRMKA